ncbi:threonine ammonia-lyase, biosynthetic [Devosia sp. XJ19-1]|uniref:L-threonine dehydratase n=1 Tax=Devosia ureilytica TaxID=2952754 RepID=A0A9Q4APX9_9HYPH|nr:threonine ammonia-lyase, biosynthetic [Devosia ureilytica]MCP8884554.1 threonine ammonia-lyase, biosynthetic [Devosia ureilytica]MCP8888184.1 threonine ammonia-lyase, biosynthetic [Devosia ureilytica]
MTDYVRKILTSSVYEVAEQTPLDKMELLSERLGHTILLKREDLQPVFSFKIRGAHNRIVHLSAEERARGVICASAGNHAQGVALSATRLGIRAIVVMPTTTPVIKVNAVRRLGGEVVLFGDAFDAARAHAAGLAEKHGYVFVHPFDDPDVIAGQGTVGLELMRQHPEPIGAIYVPVGGGGLAAGIASFVKFLRPEIRVIGVEPEEAASMKAAIAAGHPVPLDQVGLFADGVAVRQVGDETFRLCRELLDDIVTVSADEICAAIKDIFDDHRAISEPAGALALAGLRRDIENGNAPEGALIAINSGANVNFDRLRYVAERAEIGERAEALLAVTIPERPGSYRAFIRLIGSRAITEFNYRYAPGANAHIFVGIKLSGGDAEKHDIITMLTANALAVTDLTDNEVAKLHVRHMVGGRAAGLGNEMVFRFQFPERPGALLKFLEGLNDGWNITLFHYRNHGADYGRVLVGIAVPAETRADLFAHIDAIGFPYWDETENPAYRQFLDLE